MSFQIGPLNAYYRRVRALDRVGAVLQSGELTAVVGPNGAGKSTLLRHAAGLATPAFGDVRLDGRPILSMTPRERARRIAYLPPDSRAAWPMTGFRIAALGRAPFLKPLRDLGEADRDIVRDALFRARALHLEHRPFNELSSGEKARILIARALATQADVLILDEPTAALDPRWRIGIMDVLRAEAQRGATLLFAAHDLDLVAAYADRVLLIYEGAIVADGPPESALSEANLSSWFEVEAPGGVKASGWRPVAIPGFDADG